MIETVPEALAGERLDRVVALLTGCSRSEAAGLVEQGAVTIGGHAVTAGKHRVGAGDVVEVEHEVAEPVLPVADRSVELAVVHEDADVIVVDKPPGLVVHPGAGHGDGTLVNGLLARYPEIAGVGDPTRPGIVHRLDRDTSGLLAVARTPDAYEALTAALAERLVTREYLALVHGRPEADAGLVDAPVGEVDARADAHDGLRARARGPHPVRGRVAQRRARRLVAAVHVGDRPHPPDPRAPPGDRPPRRRRRHLRRWASSIRSPRVFLHAARLAFAHPRSGLPVVVESPLPPDLADVLDLL